jgi:hypothetical protein
MGNYKSNKRRHWSLEVVFEVLVGLWHVWLAKAPKTKKEMVRTSRSSTWEHIQHKTYWHYPVEGTLGRG